MAIQPAGPMDGQQLELHAIDNLHLVNNAADDRLQAITNKLIRTLQEALEKSQTNNRILAEHNVKLTNEINLLNQRMEDLALASTTKENALNEQVHELQSKVDKQKPLLDRLKQLISIKNEWKKAFPFHLTDYKMPTTNSCTGLGFIFRVDQWWHFLRGMFVLADEAESIIREDPI